MRLSSSGSRGSSDTITYPLFDELAALVWAANLAALELHVPQWTIGARGQRRMPDRLVFDLGLGPDTTIVECARVAERLYGVLVKDGLTPVAKTSGSKGMQVYASVRTRTAERISAYAKSVAQRFVIETPCTGRKLGYRFWPGVSCGGSVLVEWSAETLSASNLVDPCRERDHVRFIVGSAQKHSVALVAASGVVMGDVDVEYVV